MSFFPVNVRVALCGCLMILTNYFLVMVNERTGGFASPRYRIIGVFYECSLLVLITVILLSQYDGADRFWWAMLTFCISDLGNSRELSLRWMLYGAAQTGPLRWVQAFSRHLHHHAVCVSFSVFAHHWQEEAYQNTMTLFLGALFVTHSCQLCLRMRFKCLTKVMSIVMFVVAVGVIIATCVGEDNPVDLRISGALGFSGTVMNIVLNWKGGYVESKVQRSGKIRGRERRRSVGGLDYEHLLTSVAIYDVRAGEPSSENETSGADVVGAQMTGDANEQLSEPSCRIPV